MNRQQRTDIRNIVYFVLFIVTLALAVQLGRPF